MDLQQLKYFVEVAKQESFTKASQVLLVSQPSISKMIKNLEDELKATLLDRSERKIKLTDVGAIVYEQALKILQSVEDVYSSVNELVHIEKGTIKMGLMPTIGVLLFPNILAGFKGEYPQIDIDMVQCSAKQLTLKVKQGDIDLGVTVMPVDYDIFETIPLLSEELVVIVDSEHWLVEKESVHLSDLKNESFILLTEDYVLHDVVTKSCVQSGFEPKVAYKSSLWDIMGEMVATQVGISIIPRSMVSRFNNEKVHAISISYPIIDWELVLIYKKNKYLSFAAREFIKYIQSNKL
ncbi:LysR family transcriptional regulator [Metabacillus fastidiosus]|uniref:LysR family transcriptional regulator n=1 Tax=Metabacillus fastidiosus TaxID=1458 RepID=A0ABU6P0D0_9BACI|nr:LysR family transcriptional regulator [Metabacillus fastidiosus]MED4401949.1 LysR family transcriptional regulator [Metabacillus fastidiosus]MED4460918.1 LysR family transcriptional regulator [Metabacillus fastidiosus]